MSKTVIKWNTQALNELTWAKLEQLS